jgi:hypothetical protein
MPRGVCDTARCMRYCEAYAELRGVCGTARRVRYCAHTGHAESHYALIEGFGLEAYGLIDARALERLCS